MISMVFRTNFRTALVVACVGLAAISLTASGQDVSSKRGRKYKAPPPTAKIEVTILKDVNGKPIENAAVVFHPMEGNKDKGNMELKTNEDGKMIIDVLPINSTVRVQVIAPGFQTYGEDYKIEKPEMALEIRMKRPGEQYSIYKLHDSSEVGGKDADTAATPNTQPGQSAPAPR
ncbi:MAG: carboxypeptidase-like regulatory domain-containing protein [Terracidiphilus sp.]